MFCVFRGSGVNQIENADYKSAETYISADASEYPQSGFQTRFTYLYL